MKTFTKKFRKPIHKLASNNGLQPNLNYIFFKDDMLYVTDAQALLAQALELHDFTKEEITLLNGYCIHRKAFEMLTKFDILTVVSAGQIIAKKDEVETIFNLKKWDGANADVKMVDFEAVINNAYENLNNLDPVDKIGISPKLLALLSDCMFTDYSVRLRVAGANKPIIVDSLYYNLEQKAIIMPVMITKY